MFLKIFTKIFYSSYFFCMVVTLEIFKLHISLSSNVFDCGNLYLINMYDISKYANLEKFYYVISFVGIYVFSLFIYNIFFRRYEDNEKFLNVRVRESYKKDNDFYLLVGSKFDNSFSDCVSISEKGLYQNILVTGTIGSGKTSSALYPFTKQLMAWNSDNNKVGMLILDVKGNYYKKVLDFAMELGRIDDVRVLELNGKYRYNPLDKPDLKPMVIANRLKTVLMLFSSQGNSDSYWIDKAESVIVELIKLCRIYNNGYVNFEEIHKLITSKAYLESKINKCRDLFIANKISKTDICDLESVVYFFANEYQNLDSRVVSIIQSEVTRITQVFVNDKDVKNTFSCKKEDLNFGGFRDVIECGNIVVLKMNLAEYRNLSKILSAYIKLDFQGEVMSRLVRCGANLDRPVCFISDEYQEYVTDTDADFFAQSREAKCINIVATQSYTSLLNTLGNHETVRTIIQNLINKIWFRTDDSYTIEEAQKQIGKVFKEITSKSITENSRESNYSYILNSFKSDRSNLSESLNVSLSKDFLFDSKVFTQELNTFDAICFLSDGYKILEPCKVRLNPYFRNGG